MAATMELRVLKNSVPQAIGNLPRAEYNGRRRMAGRIATKARQKAPKRTGEMARRIEAKGASVHAGAPYSGWVEGGTRHMTARPYLRPAAEEVAATAREDFAGFELELGG